MAAVSLPAAFNYKWAENGTVDAMDDSQYKLGWAFIGATPPSVEQFNKVLQTIDEKVNYLNSRRIGNYQAAYPINSAVTLTAADVGKNVTLNTSGSLILPLGSTVMAGATFIIGSTAAGRTVSCQGSDTFNTLASTITTITLDMGDTLLISWNGFQWTMFGGSVQLPFSAQFAGSTRHRRLPGGTIIQFGTFVNGGVADTPVSFPAAFPNEVVSIQCTMITTASGGYAGYNSPTLGGFNGATWASQASRVGGTASYIAIGR